jgi:hypothetical protein
MIASAEPSTRNAWATPAGITTPACCAPPLSSPSRKKRITRRSSPARSSIHVYQAAGAPGAVDALLRRSRAPSPGADTLSFGGNTIDFRAMRAKTWTGEDAELTATEVRLLKLLWAHSGTVVSRKIVVEHLFGSTAPLTVRTLDNVVLRLRKLFERNPGEPAHLHTVRGLGFRFEP